ncbi:hypothetical protein MAR_019348 [Mya arenaria]|uniref:Tyr recombinase domain-containing protein n=1 Tax=Mya arenaria TaxID=6604 RepID=A0ABY7EHN3_MYAAR|nr:hypothetical protein MAR_019348 [Mya arenaria]
MLRWGDLELKADVMGKEYLEYSERNTKTRTDEKSSSDQRAFRPKQYAHVNPKNCPVEANKEFKKNDAQIMCAILNLLSIRRSTTTEKITRNKKEPVGENTFRGIMKNMAEKDELPGRKTNHSARKTTCTRLLLHGVAPTTIRQLTGHKNLQSELY